MLFFLFAAAFGTMDISALQKIIASDIAQNRTPLFVIGDVGASICGQVDNIQRLQEVCRTHSIWLHLRGHSLSALAITQGSLQNDSQHLQPIADSMSLNLGSWLALPNLPVVVIILIIFFFNKKDSYSGIMNIFYEIPAIASPN